MALFRRAKEVTNDLAAITQRKKLELDARRIESRITSECAGIGRELYPLLKSGQLPFDSSHLRDSVETVSALEEDLRDKKARIEVFRTREKERFVDASIANIDDNATSLASARQTASDREADRQGNPAEQGGHG
jgi:hypothetical protein